MFYFYYFPPHFSFYYYYYYYYYKFFFSFNLRFHLSSINKQKLKITKNLASFLVFHDFFFM